MKIMKKQSIYALISAIALSGAIGLASCTSSSADEAEVNPNPGYNPVTGDVPVQFVFNLAAGSAQSGTRQTADAAQADDDQAFRGIEDTHIMCFEQDGNGKFLASPTTATRDFDMARVATAASLSSTNSTRVLEMSLPLRTNTVVFYGRAITDRTKSNYKNQYGYLDGYHVEKNLDNTYFQLGRRLTESGKVQLVEIEHMLAAILTCIMETNLGSPNVQSGDGVQYPYGWDIVQKSDTHPNGINYSINNTKWSQYVYDKTEANRKSPLDSNVPMTPLEEFLAKAYYEITHIESGEMRNASAPALLSTITDLWSNINHVRCASPTSEYEAVAKYMAQLIHEEISKYFTGTVNDTGGPVTGVGFQTITYITDKLVADSYWPGDESNKPKSGDFGSITSFSKDDLKVFPETFDLPQGATHIEFNTDTKMFSYLETFRTGAVGDVTFKVDDYYYPAELLYFGNSPVLVSNKENKAGDYPKTTDDWHKLTDLPFWNPTAEADKWKLEGVKASTRSVAMKNDINYGTALLATSVGYVSGKILKDNNKAIQLRDYGVEEDDNEITPTAQSFILKGIVIGGQYPIVGWNYLPKVILSDDQENPTNTNINNGWIYDKVMASNGAIPASGTSDPTYTLVFDNYKAGENAQDKVYVALELQNNTGKGFFGAHNLIPNGSNFYLVGLLDPAHPTTPISSWSDFHALPPYNNSDNTCNRVQRVFIQDHKTVVNFKLGETSLKSAYLTVPDLRSSSVTLGLSVDMKWETGLNFDVEFGGSGN